MPLSPQYSLAEEIANAVSHGIGALLSVAGLTLLLTYAVQQQDLMRIISFTIYSASLVILFLASTLYHAIVSPKAKHLFKLFDHCAIYLLIAGTYTPLMLITLNDRLGFIMLTIIWLLAFAGIFYKIFCKNQNKALSVASYLGLGFVSIFCLQQIANAIDTNGLTLLCLGGGFYAFGVIFYVNHKIPFNHAIWHLFVLAGAACHYFMMWLYV
ncbi:hemolysin III family protein [Colwellia sp. 1_MG-2023]|uniref:PAQR family membrane homeostasis protein TrhA n=1 Tax=Colwellia sp. 1_MG-2023 TaxID=3062649 RepID=UPI0026E33924|nr:hemolysin III family protein [Colwellia sp. 1_MG-2023]MDO6444574.1 hemolysin III family protein [Colwellia sp. 1_MG-2023]